MVQLMQRLLADVLASAVVTGGTMAYTASQPIDGASIFDLDDLAVLGVRGHARAGHDQLVA